MYRDLELKWKLRPGITCIIKETGESCEDYLENIPPSTNDGCEVDVEYQFKVKNTGEVCEKIESVVATVDGTQEENIPVMDWLFCPEDVVSLVDRRTENLCNYEGQEIDFKVELNDKPGNPGESFFSFPERNGATSPP